MSDLMRIQSNPSVQPGVQPAAAQSKAPVNGASFADFLAKTQTQTQQVRFSNHAQKRLESRNISLSDDRSQPAGQCGR